MIKDMPFVKFFNYYLIGFAMLTFVACEDVERIKECQENGERLEAEVKQKDHYINSINVNLGGLNDIMDSLTLAQIELETNLLNADEEKLEKIIYLEKYIKRSNEKIKVFEENLNSQIGSNRILKRTIKNFKLQLNQKEEELQELQNTLVLKEQIVANKNKELIETKDSLKESEFVVASLGALNEEMSENIGALEKDLKTAEGERKKAIEEEIAQKNFEIGVRLFNELDRIKSRVIVNKKNKLHRKKIAEDAYSYLTIALKKGKKESKEYLNKLLYEKKLRKHLNIKNPVKLD